MKKLIARNIIFILLCLGVSGLLAGCAAVKPKAKEVIKKGSRYVRDREKDYHASGFVSRLQVPEDLSTLDASREQHLPKDVALAGEPNVNIIPPGLL